MTLHEYLSNNKIVLDRKTESRLGEIISDKHREVFTISAPKISSSDLGVPVNFYSQEFLSSCEETIIQFLNKSYEKTNG